MKQDEKLKSELLKILGMATFFIAFLVYSALVGGLIVYKFYYWFIIPVFVTLPEISFISAVGLSMAKLAFTRIETKKDERETDWPLIIISPWVTLFFGWILHEIIK